MEKSLYMRCDRLSLIGTKSCNRAMPVNSKNIERI